MFDPCVMAAFIAKQVVGDKLSSVKGAIPGGKDEEGGGGDDDKEAAEAAEIEEQRREMEEKRKEKHRKMEEERENMRQGIRDKYGIKKKEEPPEEPVPDPMADGRIGRKKLTPAEMAAAQSQEEEEDEFAKFPTNLSELQAKVGEIPGKMREGIGEVSEKCCLQ